MGNWQISIEGLGPVGNLEIPTDATELLKRFVVEAEKAGQKINRAVIYYSSIKEVK